MVRAVTATFQPALTSALTTAGTFATFMIAEFRGFSEFGFIAALGVMLTLLAAFLVLPPLIIVMDRSRWGRTEAAAAPRPIPHRAIPAPVALFVALAFIAAAAYGGGIVRTIRFHNDFKKLRGESPAMEFYEYVDRSLGRRFNPAAVVVETVDDARAVTALARESIEEDPETLLDRAYSIADFLPADVDRRMERIAELKDLLSDPKLDRAEDKREKLEEARRLVAVEPWGIEDVPESIRRRFLTRDGKGFLAYVWPRSEHLTDEQLFAWQAEIDRLASSLRERRITFAIGDETLIAAWVSRMVREETPFLSSIAGLVVFLLLLIDFRRIGRSVLVATPLAAGMLVFAGAIHVTGQELNLFNIIMVPSIIGIGIDNSVHIYHRYRLEGEGSVLKVLRLTGMGTFLASLTTALGFGSALVSHHLGLRTMGMMAVSGIGATFVTATIFFPCLLVLIEKARERIRGTR